MSKLYMQGGSDARRTPVTSRGHRAVNMDFLFNWKGGNIATGGVETAMFHRGNTVVFEYRIKGTSDTTQITFYPDGTYSTAKL